MTNTRNISCLKIFICTLLFIGGFAVAGSGATFTVTKIADTNDNLCDADCSFREAVAAANVAPTDDIINFADAVFSSPRIIVLGGGALIINNSGTLTINGTGSGNLTISGNNATQIFSISAASSNAGAHLIVNSLTLSDGFANGGGGIVSSGQRMTLTNCVVRNSRGFPGVIYNNGGTINISNSMISDNIGSALENERGTLTITNSTVSGNTSIGINNDRGILNISGSTISGNQASGIRNVNGSANLNNVLVTGNTMSGFGSQGGGVFNFGDGGSNLALMTITNSTIRNNSVSGENSNGGGIWNVGNQLTVRNTTVAGNSSANGDGGGIYSGRPMTIVNSTITGNRAGRDGGGIYSSWTANLTNATINGNSAVRGGGVYRHDFDFTARNVIFGDNTDTGYGPDVYGILTSEGYNLIENVTGTSIIGTTTGNILGQDARLLPLGVYGGATPTVALQPTSPAIDAGDPENIIAADQRGVMRPQDGDLNGSALPDIGAYERRVTVLTVNKTADTNDGVCDGDCSLREAIAANNTLDGDKAIIFDAALFSTAQTVTLTGGQILIANSGATLLINGNRADLLTISGNNLSRVFNVDADANVTISNLTITGGRETNSFAVGAGIYNNGGNLTVNNLVLRNNTATFGGGINSHGVLTVYNSTFINNTGNSEGGGLLNNGTAIVNTSTFSGNSSNGGGIWNSGNLTVNGSSVSNSTLGNGIQNSGGTVMINNSSISNNANTGITSLANNPLIINNSVISNNRAGGIYGGSMNITNSIISGNRSDRGGGIYGGNTVVLDGVSVVGNTTTSLGGGIYLDGGTLTVNNSVLSGNSALLGGGVANNSSTTLNFTNSTISSNTAIGNVGRGGGGYLSGTVNFTHVTIDNNSSNFGGGLYNAFATINSRNSIIADNSAVSSAVNASPDVYGPLTSMGYNLIENTQGAMISGATTGNIIGQDPRLAPLRSNGGATQTHALLPGSPAIDAGDPSNVLAADQRGAVRPRDGDGNGSTRTDIGAFELQPIGVTTTNDSGFGSLRQALLDVMTTGDAIVFGNAFNTPRTITLTSGELIVPANANFTINGRGADKLTINGGNASRVLVINPGANVYINGVTVTGGNSTNSTGDKRGGGILNKAVLTIANSVVANNKSPDYGGGIFNDDNALLNFLGSSLNGNSANIGGGIANSTNANLTVGNSIIDNNTAASGYGGGISNSVGTMTVNNSTVSRNTGNGIYNGGTAGINSSTISGNNAPNGGGIFSDVMLNLTNTTIANNTATNYGGGIFTNAGTVNSRNTIVADNNSSNNLAPDFSGTLVSQGYNLIENTNGSIISGTANGNIYGQDPQLLPLGSYGATTPTQALRLNSPAIDKGNNFGIGTDQRGQLRPYDFPNVTNAAGGNGADIGAFERQANDSAGSKFFDFDGDGKSDISVFRPENGSWYIQQSTAGFTGAAFGLSTDKLVPADYDGDGKTDIAVVRNGIWYLQRSSLGFTGIQFGDGNDIPVPADYDGDGKAELAVFRPSNGYWYLLNLTTNLFTATQFGQNGDKPVAADYDGDGKTDIAVNRSGNWYINRSQLGFTGVLFGDGNDKTVPADYDGDGKADIAVFRPSNGTWYLQQSTAGFAGTTFGLGTDIPVAADYDGDGKADIAVVRNGNWYLNRTTQGFTGILFGTSTDLPVPNSFVR